MTKTSTSGEFDADAFRHKLMRWYRAKGRHPLPWRLTLDPYAVLVSEVMLQQTQVERVVPYYRAWLERWPDFAALAASTPAEAIQAWRGLGYNRRALNLHRVARIVTESHAGKFPIDTADIRSLPGVGEYTASAVQSFAREKRVSVADTNIARLVARLALGVSSQRAASARDLRTALNRLLPERNVRGHNLALMDLGSTVCTARNPACGHCPVASMCRWRAVGYPAGEAALRPKDKFESTARFARGRIIDALRESPRSSGELESMLPDNHRLLTATYLRALARDGMVVEADGYWSLPG